jgi:hypothetical protein
MTPLEDHPSMTTLENHLPRTARYLAPAIHAFRAALLLTVDASDRMWDHYDRFLEDVIAGRDPVGPLRELHEGLDAAYLEKEERLHQTFVDLLEKLRSPYGDQLAFLTFPS